MRSIGSGGVALTVVSLILLAVPAAASAPTNVKGEPQPEAAPFRLSTNHDDLGSAAILPDGEVALAFQVERGGVVKTEVCMLARGSRSCTHRAYLEATSQIGEHAPQVIAVSNSDVDVLQDQCCSQPSQADDDLLWTSTNAGKSFSYVPAGSAGVDTATVAGGKVVYTQSGGTEGVSVTDMSLSHPETPTDEAQLGSLDTQHADLSAYRGGVLLAYTNDSKTRYVADVEYAAAGSDFATAKDYHSVGSFTNANVLGISGDALLTEKGTSPYTAQLRVFNGTSFGRPVNVPGFAGIQYGESTVIASKGRIAVFADVPGHGYDVYEAVTTNDGAAWSSRDLGHLRENPEEIAGALDSTGSGVLLGFNSDYDVYVYPVLSPVRVSIATSHSRRKVGKAVTVHGSVRPGRGGASVYLQEYKHGLWHTIGTAHETSGHNYAFSVSRSSPTTLEVRVVSNDRAGYVEYGYSGSKTVHFVR